ncbi:MAG: histidine--tRNA ligase [Alphaproteobacteria bacterium]|nr:histidine--tRNA ligase [Alphaproteobacteria bacterium]
MDLKPTKPLTGFIELLPSQQRCFDYCANRMQDVLKTAGFNRLDLPSIERAEVLTDKDNWDEIETQIFLFQKGDTKMGLRYDGTVGLARYIAGHLNNLTFPFRAYQFAKNYRGERPQRGRYREFCQMDIDIMGIDTLSVNYEADIIATLARMYESVSEFIGKTKIKIGNRKFWNAMFEYLKLDESQSRETFILIDKRDKISDFKDALTEVIGKDKAQIIENVFVSGYKSFADKSEKFDTAIKEMDNLMSVLRVMGVENAEIDISIMRGHSYYTGVVFEFFSADFPDLPAIGGGGRYENLVSKFSKTKIVGVGGSVGVSRMLVALMDENKIDLSQFENNVDVAVLVMGNQNVSYAMNLVSALRKNGIVAVPYLDTDKKFKNQIEYADKIGARFAAIIGDDEVANNIVSLKNMESGVQEPVTLDTIVQKIKVK